MIGRQYLIAGKAERISGYQFTLSSVKLVTDKRVREFDEHQLMTFLKKDCMEMEEEYQEMVVTNQSQQVASAAPVQQIYVPSFSNSHFAELRQVLMNNIEKVQKDKEYLPQAAAVRDNVQSVIELTKNEIDFMKTVNRIKR